jgi:hypothetical protein
MKKAFFENVKYFHLYAFAKPQCFQHFLRNFHLKTRPSSIRLVLKEENMKKFNDQLFNKMLTLFVFFRVIDNSTLGIAFEENSWTYTVRKQLEYFKFIKPVNLKCRTKRSVHSKTFYCLTRAGFDYAVNNILYLDNKNADTKNVKLYSQKELKKKNRKLLNDDSMVAIMSAMAGAEIDLNTISVASIFGTPTVGDDEDEFEENHIKQFLRENFSEEAFQSLRLFRNTYGSECRITFHTGSDAKERLGAGNSLVTVADYASGRYRGIIDSPYKSVFLFAPPLFGMSWSRWTTKNEKAANSLWNSVGGLRVPMQIKRSGSCVGLIVDSAKQFADLYFDIDNIRKADEQFGGTFDHLYIIPHNKFGVEHLNWLMRNDDIETNEILAASADESGYYRKNVNKYSSGLFPLIDNEYNNCTALGYQLDAKIIMQIERAANRNTDAEFFVLCFEWQRDYLASVLPSNVTVRVTRRIRN